MPRPGTSFVLTVLLLPLVLAALAPSAGAASVTQEAGGLPTPLVGAAGASLAGKTYVFGGRLADGTYSDGILGFDGGTLAPLGRVASFTDVAEAAGRTPGRYSGAAVTLGSRIYYFGGAQLTEADLNGDNNKERIPSASKDIWEFNPTTNTMRRLTGDQLPLGAWGLSGVAYENRIYLFGGFTFDVSDIPSTQRHDWVLEFDPSKPDGQKVNNLEARFGVTLPYKVQDAAVARINNRILVMGGLSDHDNNTNPCPTYSYYNAQTGRTETAQPTVCLTKRIVSFDPVNNIVRGVAGELPYRAQFISAATVDNKAYVAGALLSDGTASASIVEVALDQANTPRTRVLTPTLPRGAFGQAVATDGATITLLGGRYGDAQELLSDIVRIDPRATAPWAPRGAAATDIPGGVRLTWEPPTYNGDAVVSSYRIYRAAAGAVEQRIGETPTLSFDDTTVSPGVEYVWRVSAVNAVGESNASARITRSAGITVPGVVSAFSAFPGNNEVVLRWKAPTELGGANLSGYRLLRNDEILATLPATNDSFTDLGVANGQTYVYRIKAYNSKGDGFASDAQRVTPAPVPPAPREVMPQPLGESQVQLTWAAPSEPVDTYIVYRSTRAGAPGIPIANVTDPVYIDNVERGQTYFYSIASKNDVGTSPPSAEVAISLVRTPGAPTDVAALGMEGEIRVQWTAPSDTGDAAPSALRYYVSRIGGGSSRSIIVKTDIEGTSFTDRTVTPGQSYTYTVTTLNPMASAPSAAATATARAIQNKAPTALLAILPSIASAGDPVELDASQSSDLDGTIRTYLFDFGDGTDPVRTTTPSVTHEYAVNGTFLATVLVTDDRNEVSAPATATIVVGEVISNRVDTEFPGAGTAPGAVKGPGSDAPKSPVPAPSLVLVGVVLAAVALSLRRR